MKVKNMASVMEQQPHQASERESQLWQLAGWPGWVQLLGQWASLVGWTGPQLLWHGGGAGMPTLLQLKGILHNFFIFGQDSYFG